jgi:hypothetical protein
MSLAARGIALQGFLLTPVAMAVQGMLAGDEIVTPPPEQPAAPTRAASSQRRSTSMSLAEYQAMVKRLYGTPAAPLQLSKQEQAKRRTMRQRKQHRIAALALQVLE